ncbi:rod shape-determining protein RodA [Paenibacillus sp. HWE-109]|uniref:FtsW/RodA/SpoVE family cell cycle protein n=1 Tax=Paenibacillus sp. HWE-109 TaxID=1306526 RepID=UPI001EE0A5F2|nr:FtsW/RodA/SpoVE family cell cycle protein [Paenibacillus sp. HWE-109]UKS27809.1 rod shape-determining protein RodA [Paenibacillus sp. HWE-109]
MAFLLKRIITKLDWIILLLLLVFMFICIFCIYSATLTDPDLANSPVKMIVYYIAGFIVLFAMLFVNYRVILKFSTSYYLIGLGLLVLLYFKGSTINNAQGWFKLGPISLQPAELCKLILILFLAYYLSNRKSPEAPLNFLKDVIPMGVITFIPFVLVLMQPDLGNSIGYLVIFIVICWFGNIRLKHALIGLGIVIVLCGSSLYSYVKYHENVQAYMVSKNKAYWLDRIDAVLLPEEASEKATYHMKQSVRAIGSGALQGDGYLHGGSVQGGQVPYTYADSIFVVIGEEFGFMGSSALIILYFLLIYKMITTALMINNKAGIYIIGGIAAMFLFQVFENIGMLIGLMPITGITLPFISYGGTSLLINMLSVGFVLNIRIYDDVEIDDILVG